VKSSVIILTLSVCWSIVLIILGIVSGWVTLSIPAEWVLTPFSFVYRHLRLSLIPFSVLLLAYVVLVRRICALLRNGSAEPQELLYYDRLLNATIATFFGVGVIWTAIGMETALVDALSAVDGSRQAASLTAWDLLDRLVNGGLLLALSTTVFGGFCGYLLRLGKIVLIGRDWDRIMLQETARS
jgi:hypothetical protein